MGLDIWFAEDVCRALLAAEASSALTAVEAAWAPGTDPMVLRAYRRGYKAALCVVALAFGLAPAMINGLGTVTAAGAGVPVPKE